jgi:uncharacterized protein (TIGR02265 family)
MPAPEKPDTKVKGSVLLSRLAFVHEQAGAEAVERVLARLPAGLRAQATSVLPSGWYPFELSRQLDAAIVEEVGGGRSDFFLRLGAASAERNLTGVHRGFLVPGDPHRFLSQAPQIYAFYYDRGRRTYERTGEREAVLVTEDAETFSAPDCLTVVGWHVKALQMCGAQGVRVVEEECRARGAAVCRYRVRWESPP